MKIPTEQTLFWFILGSGFTTVKEKGYNIASARKNMVFLFSSASTILHSSLSVPQKMSWPMRAPVRIKPSLLHTYIILYTKRTAFVNASNDTYNGRGGKMSYENNEATDPYLRYLLVVLVLVLVPDRQRPVRTLSSDVVDQHELQQTGVYAAHAHAVPHVHGRQIRYHRQSTPETVWRGEKIKHCSHACKIVL